MKKLSWLVAAIVTACVYCSYGQGLNPVVPSTSVDLTGTTDGGGTGIITNMSKVYATTFHGSGAALTGISAGGDVYSASNNVFNGNNAFNGTVSVTNKTVMGATNDVVDGNFAWESLAVLRVAPPYNSIGIEIGGTSGGALYFSSGGVAKGNIYSTSQGNFWQINSGAGSLQGAVQTAIKWANTYVLFGDTSAQTFTNQMRFVQGATGNWISNIWTTTVLTNFGTVNAGAATELAIPLVGVKANDAVALRNPAGIPAGVTLANSYCTNGVLILRCDNPTAGSIDVSTDRTYGATVIGY